MKNFFRSVVTFLFICGSIYSQSDARIIIENETDTLTIEKLGLSSKDTIVIELLLLKFNTVKKPLLENLFLKQSTLKTPIFSNREISQVQDSIIYSHNGA